MPNKYKEFMNAINDNHNQHARGSRWFTQNEKIAVEAAFEHFSNDKKQNEVISDKIGLIHLPYFQMGNINSTHLFGIDELIIFNFYQNNINKYKAVADIGANIGLHSIVLSKLGFKVISYEPDPLHFDKLLQNMVLNKVQINPINAAVSHESGKAEFTRVLGNTTGSHLTGVKESYGEVETFEVELKKFKDILSEVDLVKMDVEGHEANLITSIDGNDLKSTDIILEVGNVENSQKIFQHINAIGGYIFCQKINWARANKIEDIPISHREGSAFITSKVDWSW